MSQLSEDLQGKLFQKLLAVSGGRRPNSGRSIKCTSGRRLLLLTDFYILELSMRRTRWVNILIKSRLRRFVNASERNKNAFSPHCLCATQMYLNPPQILPVHGGRLRTAVNASLCLCGSGQPSNTCCLSLLLWLPPRGLAVDSLGGAESLNSLALMTSRGPDLA